MKIQLAVDRVTIDKAIEIIDEAKEYIDIIEIGTSLFLDYGLDSLRTLRKRFNHEVLADIKTIDEAEYEFTQVYENGADIATVMGVSSIETIRLCQRTAKKYCKDYMIDMLEISKDKMSQMEEFEDAIICLHIPKDKDGDINKYLEDFLRDYPIKNRLAAAGGIKIQDLPYLNDAGIEIAIVGSSITGSNDVKNTARLFKEKI